MATEPRRSWQGKRDWRDDAACASLDGDIMFPSDKDVDGIAAAKAICAGCPVADDCLRYALETRAAHGVWGGTTPDERRQARRDAS